ncbi:enolase C-terminal domain-like protein [Balneolaceae bacterium ANBcel3]|nr:enolase C-terminal domain-like protein [Balneolaceae bacterium ANBcel3]
MNSFDLYRYSIPFYQPLTSAKGSITSRQGLILTDDHHLWTEISPLPGFSKETTSQAISFLTEYKNSIKQSLEDFTLSSFLESHSEHLAPLPSVRFGLSMLAEQQKALSETLPLSSLWLLNENPAPTTSDFVIPAIKLNGIAGVSSEHQLLTSVSDLEKKGFECIKVKLPPQLNKAITRLETLLSTFKSIRFRLDANQGFSPDEAMHLLKSLKGIQEKVSCVPIDYVEEPVFGDWLDVIPDLAAVGIPLAADESVRCSEDAKKLLTSKGFRVLILKPCLFGSFSELKKVKHIASLASPEHSVVVSSSLESSIGIQLLKHLAAYFDPVSNTHHGLATTHLFSGSMDAPTITLSNHAGAGFSQQISSVFSFHKEPACIKMDW